jgi:hypothetical protein
MYTHVGGWKFSAIKFQVQDGDWNFLAVILLENDGWNMAAAGFQPEFSTCNLFSERKPLLTNAWYAWYITHCLSMD